MIYTLFIWTVVAHAHGYNPNMDWRPIAQVESSMPRELNVDDMLAKCAGVARELNIPRERYRCVRTK